LILTLIAGDERLSVNFPLGVCVDRECVCDVWHGCEMIKNKAGDSGAVGLHADLSPRRWRTERNNNASSLSDHQIDCSIVSAFACVTKGNNRSIIYRNL